MNNSSPGCLLCSTPTRMWEAHKKQYWYCPVCECIMLDPRFHVSPHAEKERYLKHQNTHDNVGYRAWLTACMKAYVLPYRNQVHTLLDFGSGPTPLFRDLVQERGIAVSIYDRYFAPHEEVLTGTYDMITCLEVFEHLEDPRAVFDTLRSLLHPQGLLVIQTRFHPHTEAAFQKWWYPTDETHRVFFTKSTLCLLAERMGMQVRACDDTTWCIFEKKR